MCRDSWSVAKSHLDSSEKKKKLKKLASYNDNKDGKGITLKLEHGAEMEGGTAEARVFK